MAHTRGSVALQLWEMILPLCLFYRWILADAREVVNIE
jgi:hypothetical protein